MNKSESLKELASAMARAQGQIKGAMKDTTNPFFKSKYADLSSVVEAIRTPLSSNGLSYVQVAHDAESSAKIETIILHSSGEWLSCGAVSVPVAKADAQGFGSAMTYARRYGLSAAFGVAPEDDDGNAAAKAAPKTPAYSAPHKPTDGAWESLTPDLRTVVFDLSNRVRTMAAKGDIKGACDEVDDTLKEFEDIGDMKIALFDKLADVSSVRSAMKKEWALRREHAAV